MKIYSDRIAQYASDGKDNRVSQSEKVSVHDNGLIIVPGLAVKQFYPYWGLNGNFFDCSSPSTVGLFDTLLGHLRFSHNAREERQHYAEAFNGRLEKRETSRWAQGRNFAWIPLGLANADPLSTFFDDQTHLLGLQYPLELHLVQHNTTIIEELLFNQMLLSFSAFQEALKLGIDAGFKLGVREFLYRIMIECRSRDLALEAVAQVLFGCRFDIARHEGSLELMADLHHGMVVANWNDSEPYFLQVVPTADRGFHSTEIVQVDAVRLICDHLVARWAKRMTSE